MMSIMTRTPYAVKCVATVFFLILGSMSMAYGGSLSSDCKIDGYPMYGKIQVVSSHADVKVQLVTSFPDLKVKKVTSFADDCGEWEMVTSFPDTKIQYVDSFPDVKVEFVDSFPGMP